MEALNTYQTVYFVGIGGIGMSALARYFHASGKTVLGYDKMRTKLTSALVEEGIAITFEDIISENIKGLLADETLVVYTPAIKSLDILNYFQEQKFQVLKRAKVLGLITENTTSIAIAGTHGKTTTSSLVAHLCNEAGLPFSCFLGGIAENFKSNFYFKGTEISVVEADEYDRSFLTLSPDWAIITSTDADHLDIYGDEKTIQQGFQDFADLIPAGPQLFVRKGIEVGKTAKTYAVNEKADYYADHIREIGDKIYFDFYDTDDQKTEFVWEIPGIHNVENATAAISLLINFGVDIETLKKGIANFKGIKRRYTKHVFENGKIFIDDYAHHPTELNAVIGSVKTFYPDRKLLVVFQPHLFSRTRDFAEGFARSLENADDLLLLDIYPARELQENYPETTAEWLLEKVNLKNKKTSSLSGASDRIKEREFDILLTVGAGDIDTLSDGIIEWLGHKE